MLEEIDKKYLVLQPYFNLINEQIAQIDQRGGGKSTRKRNMHSRGSPAKSGRSRPDS